MRYRLSAVFVFLVLPTLILWAYDFFRCAVGACLIDDASERAVALFGVPLMLTQAVICTLILLPSMVFLKARVGVIRSSLIVTAVAVISVCLVLHRGENEESVLVTICYLGLPLTFAWSVTGVIANTLWPTTN
jgi:hypothetical protein